METPPKKKRVLITKRRSANERRQKGRGGGERGDAELVLFILLFIYILFCSTTWWMNKPCPLCRTNPGLFFLHFFPPHIFFVLVCRSLSFVPDSIPPYAHTLHPPPSTLQSHRLKSAAPLLPSSPVRREGSILSLSSSPTLHPTHHFPYPSTTSQAHKSLRLGTRLPQALPRALSLSLSLSHAPSWRYFFFVIIFFLSKLFVRVCRR